MEARFRRRARKAQGAECGAGAGEEEEELAVSGEGELDEVWVVEPREVVGEAHFMLVGGLKERGACGWWIGASWWVEDKCVRKVWYGGLLCGIGTVVWDWDRRGCTRL